jgi:uncharacterized membrane protein
MSTHNFTIKELYKEAWTKVKEHAWYLFCVLLGSSVLMAAVSHSSLMNALVSCIVDIAIVSISLIIISDKKPVFSDLLSSFKSYETTWHYILASLLFILAIVLGLILLILPGLYLAVRLGFYKFIVVEHPTMSATDALKESMRVTKGHFWKIIGFILAAIILNILGAMVFLVGLVITIPVTVIANAYLYKKLQTSNAHIAA